MVSKNLVARVIYPFYIANQNPFIQIFGLPKSEPAAIVNDGSLGLITALDMVSNTVQGHNANEALVLDGESYRLNFEFKYAVDGTEYLMQLPVVRHSSGRFDNFIRSWHHVFRLSNAEQKQFLANQLSYDYAYNGRQIISVDTGQSGIGDLRLGVARYLMKSQTPSPRQAVMRASIKLPTGDSEKLMGSGGTDISLEIAMQDENLLSRYRIGVFGQVGALWLGSSDLFYDVQRHVVAYGAAGMTWNYSNGVILRSQLNLHSSFYDSNIVDIGGDSVQFTVGGSILYSGANRVDIGITENLFTNATPDFGVNVTYRSLF